MACPGASPFFALGRTSPLVFPAPLSCSMQQAVLLNLPLPVAVRDRNQWHLAEVVAHGGGRSRCEAIAKGDLWWRLTGCDSGLVASSGLALNPALIKWNLDGQFFLHSTPLQI